MRNFRIVWPTVLAVVGCTAFLFASIWAQFATAADIGQIFPIKSYIREADDVAFFAYNNGCEWDDECGDNHECHDGDYYYQQKYGFLYVQPADRVAHEVIMDADEVEADVVAEEEEIDGTVPAAPEDDDGSYIYQYEEVEEMLMERPCGDIHQYMDDLYSGSPYIEGDLPGGETHESLALFTWDPAELLTWSDRETLRGLIAAAEQSSGVRRAILSDYIECLGMEAVDLSIRLEEVSGVIVPSLSDDLSQTAAFMACFRLVERGELESDEALALLQKSLLHRSDRWNCWIDEVTKIDDLVDRNNGVTSNHVLKATVLMVANSLDRLGGTISGISRQIKNIY